MIKFIFFILFLAVLFFIVKYSELKSETEKAKGDVGEVKTQQKVTVTDNGKQVDCVGTWRDVGYCKIDSCDPNKNTVGLGKQRQEFVVQTYSQNKGKPCPGPTREVDCSLNNYIECVQCGGIYGVRTPGATCDNINKCDRLIGIGERIDKWSVSSYAVLPNCIMPPDNKVTCRSGVEWPFCKCDYDISSNTYCNETNTVCEGDSSVCTVNYTKTNELPGGVCPLVNNSYKKSYDQKCSCDITRDYGPWTFTMEKCGGTNNKTSIGTRTRIITITKKGGNKACKIRPIKNEQLLENTTGIENKEGYFQFKPEVDVVGGTFQTIQIEKDFNNMDDKSCICEGEWTEWIDITTCPDRNDYTKLDSDFNKIQRRNIISNKKMYPNMTCAEERSLRCPRDCSGSYVNGICKDIYDLPINCEGNTNGLARGSKTNVFKVLKSKIDGQDGKGNITPGLAGQACPTDQVIGCNLTCNIDCAGAWRNVGECKIDRCDPNQNTRGLGIQEQEFVPSTNSQNQGRPCPRSQEIDCSLNNYIGCTQCGGRDGKRVNGASCENIKRCEGLIGIGERIDKWSVSSYNTLPYCIMPPDSKVTCYEAWPYCDCDYEISSNNYCNETNTVCEGNSSICTVDYTKRESLLGGVCTKPEPKHFNVNLDKCSCTVTRIPGDWIYTKPSCDPSNPTTFIANKRSRPITITKTGGNKACTFPKLNNNETILDTSENTVKGKINPSGTLQFGSTNDFIGATFQTVETDNAISFPNDDKCKCQGTYGEWGDWENWTNNSACPNPTDYRASDSTFTITQNRIRKRTFNISNIDNLSTNYSCPEAAVSNTIETQKQNFTCPRDCSGNWTIWGDCNTGCPGNATLANKGISTKTIEGGQATQTRTFLISKNKTPLGTGSACSFTHGQVQSQNCNTETNCPIDCSVTWSNWDECSAPACRPSNTETERTKSGTKYRYLTDAIGPFNGGKACQTIETETCTRTCPIDCSGGTLSSIWTNINNPLCDINNSSNHTTLFTDTKTIIITITVCLTLVFIILFFIFSKKKQ